MVENKNFSGFRFLKKIGKRVAGEGGETGGSCPKRLRKLAESDDLTSETRFNVSSKTFFLYCFYATNDLIIM